MNGSDAGCRGFKFPDSAIRIQPTSVAWSAFTHTTRNTHESRCINSSHGWNECLRRFVTIRSISLEAYVRNIQITRTGFLSRPSKLICNRRNHVRRQNRFPTMDFSTFNYITSHFYEVSIALVVSIIRAFFAQRNQVLDRGIPSLFVDEY